MLIEGCQRVGVALPPLEPFVNETNWGRAKDGVVGCWDGFLGLTHAWLMGEGDKPLPAWDPDAYERGLP